MTSPLPGRSTSLSNVTNIVQIGFWILIDDKEYFIPFKDYPVFMDATIGQIYNVKRLAQNQLHWPDLDADIEIEALEEPEKYLLVWK